MKKKWVNAVAVASLSSLLVAGCSSGDSAKTVSQPTNNLKGAEGLPDKPTGTFSLFINAGANWDPGAWDWGAHHDQIGIFEGLVHFSQGKVVPGIATSWKENGNVWTFTLRKDAKFSNGDPVDADAFVYSIQRSLDPKTFEGTGKVSSFFGDVQIKNWADVKAGSKKPEELGVKAIDPQTLEITLEAPDSNLIQKLGMDPWQLPVDPKVVKGQPESIWTDASKIVSDGPYMVDSLNVKTDMVLKPNPNYYGKVSLEKIHLTWASAQLKQLLVYKNNQTDVATLDAEDVPGVKSDPTLSQQLNWFDSAITYNLQVWHSMNPIFQNQKVRQAFAMAIDKQAIADKVLLGTGVPAYDPSITQWMADWIKDVGIQYNPDQAKQLLKEAGYPDGKGFPAITVLDAGTNDKVAQAIQQMWEQTLGVKVNLDMEEWGTYVTKFDQVQDNSIAGFEQNGTGPSLPDWKSTLNIPTDPNRNDLAKLAMDGNAWKGYYDIHSDTKLNANDKAQKEIDYFNSHFPKEITDMTSKGTDAFNKGDEATMKDVVKWRDQTAWIIPVYQVRNAILVNPKVHGYFPMRMWLSTPPDWLNDITIK